MPRTAFSRWNDADPFSDMRRMQDAMNRLFDGGRSPDQSGRYPSVNFRAGQDSVVMSCELPGLTEQDIDLTVQDTFITLRGTVPEPEAGADMVWHRRERPTGTFSRRVELPFRISPDHIEARFENGVLTVEMQRPEEDKPRKIEIKSS